MVSGSGTNCEIVNGCVQDLKGAAYGGTSWECSFEVSGAATINREEWGMEYEPSCGYDYLEVTSQAEGTARYCGGTGSGRSFPIALTVSSGTTNFAFRSNGMGGSGGVGFKLCLLSNKASSGVGAKFIVAGGMDRRAGVVENKFNMLSSAEQYDPLTEKWTTVASMNINRRAAVGVALGGKFIVAGGRQTLTDFEGQDEASVEQYDPLTNKWTYLAPMNYAHKDTVGVALGGKLIVAGGCCSSQTEVYDPITDKWTTVARMTYERRGPAGAALEGKFIVAGGYNSHSKTVVEQYDPLTNKWTFLAKMGTGRRHAVGVALGGKFIVAGGDGPLSSVEQYDPLTNTWAYLAPMNTARSGAVGVALGGKLIVAGGYEYSTSEATVKPRLSSVEQYDPLTDKWTYLANMSTARERSVAAVYFVDCPPGTSIVDTGCLDCRPGTFQADARQLTCTKCPSSRYHDLAKQTDVASCKPCPASKFGSLPGQMSCVACKIGQHQQHTAQSSCTNCRAGRYQNRTGQWTCDQCRDGLFTAVDGRTTCDTCEGLQGCSVGEFDTCGTSISKFASGGICLSCPPGNNAYSVPETINPFHECMLILSILYYIELRQIQE
jgi:N-acetylneuraminic acid mutarotase